MNQYVDAFTINADVCTEKMRELRQQGVNIALLDLQKVYLQMQIYEFLLPFQMVIVSGRRYCLMHLGFGLIMKAIVQTVLEQD